MFFYKSWQDLEFHPKVVFFISDGRINAINLSVSLFLDRPIADCCPEQSLVTVAAGHTVSRDAGLDLRLVVQLLKVGAIEAVEAVALFDFLEGQEPVEGGLTDRDDLLEDVPQNALAERRSRQ